MPRQRFFSIEKNMHPIHPIAHRPIDEKGFCQTKDEWPKPNALYLAFNMDVKGVHVVFSLQSLVSSPQSAVFSPQSSVRSSQSTPDSYRDQSSCVRFGPLRD